MACGINTIRAAINGLPPSPRSCSPRRRSPPGRCQTDDATLRAELAVRYDAIRARIDLIAANSGFNEVNLLNSACNSGMPIR